MGRPPKLIRWIAPFFLAIGVGLVPWTLWLSSSLPSHHRTDNWALAWSGFDVALAAGFVLIAVAAWRCSPWLEAFAAATGTLLLCDAWFDVLLESRGTEHTLAIAEALLAELPIAALCFWIARDAERFVAGAMRITSLDGLTEPGPASPRPRTPDRPPREARSQAE